MSKKDRKIELVRASYSDVQVLGVAVILEKDKQLFNFSTLELPWKQNQKQISCIPAGIYTCVKRYSEKFKWHYHILDVKGRTLILIHAGSFVENTLGCILLGISKLDINKDGNLDITSSKKAMEKLLELMPDRFELKIIP